MDGYSSRPASESVPEGYATSEADLFANFVRGKGVLPVFNPEAAAKAKRAELEELAQFSPRHAAELRAIIKEEAEAQHDRELLEFAAQISTRHQKELRSLQFAEAEAAEKLRRMEEFAEELRAMEAGWDPDKHPRTLAPPNPGWWAKTGGGGGRSGDGGPGRHGRLHNRAPWASSAVGDARLGACLVADKQSFATGSPRS